MWLDLVSGLIDTGKGYLSKAADTTLPDADASLLITDSEMIANHAYSFLQRLHGTDAGQIPHQIVGPFQRWVDGLGITNTIFFRADHVANYELARFDLRPLVNNINDASQTLIDAADAVTWPFLRVTVPSQAMGMLPHFAIVGHELGHAIQNDIKVDLSSIDTATVINNLAARLASEGITLSTSAHLMMTQKVLASWVNEMKSDAIGCILAGPAFLFALGAFFELSGGGYGIGPSHPPSEMRRRLVLDRLAQSSPSQVEVFKEMTGTELTADLNSPHLRPLPSPDDLYLELKQKHGAETAAICVALMPFAEAVAPLVFDEAERVVRAAKPGMVYDAARLREDLAEHLEPLRHLVPPIEIRKGGAVHATSLAGILNVGWAGLLTQLDRIPTPSGVSTDNELPAKMEKLHELLLKAVELSEARMIWEEQV
ncbi:hypothetical protein [Sphingopyxis sp. KK2]|uniref:hypothetical protein n=1 Tax=Sphingopyxis sp. KK2 TaxID=1855727 RepID=UPI00097E6A1F|nr:hypothetical protein [Sphingopyxis sp. KK2]